MLLKIYPENPSPRLIKKVVECLSDGGVIIFPTDTIYAIGCDIYKTKALDRLAQIKGIRKEKANFSFLFYDLSQLSDYSKPIANEVYKLMRSTLPGPYTFILDSNSNIPKIFQNKKRTIGIRIPENNVVCEIIKELGNPLVSTSIRGIDNIEEYITDPEIIYEKFRDVVDMVIDGGPGGNTPSTIIDCTGDEIVLVREGKGKVY
jgi:tRNA threonylcarbamoyl adenosine modification protein (Sua5/YciO/YrdC/YwlC family)